MKALEEDFPVMDPFDQQRGFHFAPELFIGDTALSGLEEYQPSRTPPDTAFERLAIRADTSVRTFDTTEDIWTDGNGNTHTSKDGDDDED